MVSLFNLVNNVLVCITIKTTPTFTIWKILFPLFRTPLFYFYLNVSFMFQPCISFYTLPIMSASLICTLINCIFDILYSKVFEIHKCFYIIVKTLSSFKDNYQLRNIEGHLGEVTFDRKSYKLL